MKILRVVSLLVIGIAFYRATSISTSSVREPLEIIVFVETFVITAAQQDFSNFINNSYNFLKYLDLKNSLNIAKKMK